MIAPAPENLGPAEREFLLALARKTLGSVTANGGLPDVAAEDLSPRLTEKQGCFVTLTRKAALRGCMGSLMATQPLYQAVAENTRNAALRDPRFPPVLPEEVSQVHIEISVLTEPQPLPFDSPEDLLRKLRPHEHGVLLRIEPHMATFLPQVWAQIPDPAEFMNQLSRKAGCEPAAWRDQPACVSVYHVTSFAEAQSDPNLR